MVRILTRHQVAAAVVSSLALATIGTGAPIFAQPSDGIVSSVVKAPIVADGAVAGAPTDLVINLDTSLDPAVPGRTLKAGKTIRITLPEEFESQGLPTDLPTACGAFAGECNTGVLLQGWPQRPIPPTEEFYTLEMDGTHTFVFTAVQDLGPGATPGIKQVHLMALGFTNPAGEHHILVEAETGPDGEVETGTGQIVLTTDVPASINVTSAFAKDAEDQPNGNTIYQQASVGSSPPWAWDFLVFHPSGGAWTDVELLQIDDSGGQIVSDVQKRAEAGLEGGKAIGSFTIEGPDGATGQSVSGGPSVEMVAPVSGAPAGRLTAVFTAGDKPGMYVTTFQVEGGFTQQMFVKVVE